MVSEASEMRPCCCSVQAPESLEQIGTLWAWTQMSLAVSLLERWAQSPEDLAGTTQVSKPFCCNDSLCPMHDRIVVKMLGESELSRSHCECIGPELALNMPQVEDLLTGMLFFERPAAMISAGRTEAVARLLLRAVTALSLLDPAFLQCVLSCPMCISLPGSTPRSCMP